MSLFVFLGTLMSNSRFALILATLLLTISTWSAAATFMVEKIQVRGLERISKQTVLHYLPVKQGQSFNTASSSKLIQALYNTDFFTNVGLFRDGGTLVVKVEERPTISGIDITGNKQIPQDKLNEAVKKLGLQTGRFLNRATLDEVKQALQNQYNATGRYNAKVDITQTKEPRNRVAIAIKISEGVVAKVAGIQIIGNTVFPESTLQDQLKLTTAGIFSFFSRSDEYSSDKLQQSESALESYYMNHGYLRIHIDSSQVTITPDRKHVYIVIKLSEGGQYRVAGYQLTGNVLGQRSALLSTIQFKKGDIFSRQEIMKSNQGMMTLLGNKGYAFAQIQPQPKINEANKTVFVNFDVKPGRQYFVRDIVFSGNDSTSQIALRKQLYQMEGGLYSSQKIHDSVYTLQQNTYLSPQPPIQVQPVKVPGTNDMLDLKVGVAERLSAQFQLTFGYSQAYGFMASTGITQSNFMGTGKTVGFSLSASAYQKNFSVNYVNPYYTPDGVSRSISVFGSKTSSDQLSIAEYNTDSYGVNIGYSFPLSVYSSLNLGYGVTRTILKKGGSFSNTVDDFIAQHGSMYDQLMLTAGWSRRTTDRPILPTKGTIQSLSLSISAPMDEHKLEYYKLSYTGDWYQPMLKYFILHMHGTVGFGDGYDALHELPFFQNYYAGGLGVQGLNRAYYPFSLGPKDKSGNQIGGNLLVSGHISLILPDLFNSPTVRPSIFLDAGNVFDTGNANSAAFPNRFKGKNVRYSYGAQIQWWTPLNIPLIFSLAKPINDSPNDQLDTFQFTIGTMY